MKLVDRQNQHREDPSRAIIRRCVIDDEDYSLNSAARVPSLRLQFVSTTFVMPSTNSDFVYYHYTPSLPAAAIFVAVFGLSTAYHLYQCVRNKNLYMIPLLVGGACEAIGYIGRLISHVEAPYYKLPPYIIQSLLLLIAPAIISASVYMVLGRVIAAVDGESRCMIKRMLLTPTFVIGDLTSFMVQSTGAGLLVKTNADSKIAGKWIIVGGLTVQLLFFGFFILVTFSFHRSIYKSPTPKFQSQSVDWRRVLYTLYAASILIMIRSVFRVVEYVQGDNGYLLRNEIWLYIFDATLMAAVMLLFNIEHPSKMNISLKDMSGVKSSLHNEKVVRTTNDSNDQFVPRNSEEIA